MENNYTVISSKTINIQNLSKQNKRILLSKLRSIRRVKLLQIEKAKKSLQFIYIVKLFILLLDIVLLFISYTNSSFTVNILFVVFCQTCVYCEHVLLFAYFANVYMYVTVINGPRCCVLYQYCMCKLLCL